MTQISIEYGPSNSIARIHLDANDEFTTNAGTMVAMSSNLSVTTSTYQKNKGGIMKSLGRLLVGQSFFLNHYKANQPSELWISHSFPGDLSIVEMKGESMFVQAGSFLGCEPTITTEVSWQGAKNFLSGESLLWVKCKGHGKLILASYGAIMSQNPPENFIVDTGHIVAFEESLNYSISKAGSSWLHSFLGGEGLVCKFSGQGKLYCQSHNHQAFGYALRDYLKPIPKNS